MRSKVGDRMSQERYRNVSCLFWFKHLIPAFIKSIVKQRQPEVRQEMM